jgi:hypothetical protein
MEHSSTADAEFERRLARRLLEVLIRATLLLAMALLCYRVLAPFLPLATWAQIFAGTSAAGCIRNDWHKKRDTSPTCNASCRSTCAC